MHSILVRLFTVAAILVGAIPMAHAQKSDLAAQNFDRGKYEYEAHCAVCHGMSGIGDGSFAQLFRAGTLMPNLTEFSKKNNGVFPFKRIYETIDGTQNVEAHGTKLMPVWGPRYKFEAGRRFDDDFPADSEAFVRARILALTEYLYHLQAK